MLSTCDSKLNSSLLAKTVGLPEIRNKRIFAPLIIYLSWESTGLPCGSLRVQSPAGPTLRVLKELRRKCCLCNDIYKRLDVLVFSDKDDKP